MHDPGGQQAFFIDAQAFGREVLPRGRIRTDLFRWQAQGVSRADSDEAYVLDLCDEILGSKGLRQHRFDWLRGDPGMDGRRATLPVDAYWSKRHLVVEYHERQHREPVAHFDKPDQLTVSGVHRGEQRARYDQLRQTLVPAHGLRLVVIESEDLDAGAQGRLHRHQEQDLAAIRRLLDPVTALPPVPAHTESQLLAAFERWLTGRGWMIVAATDRWADIEAVRGDQRLIGEAKGHKSSPGLDVDTDYGRLLRRMTDSAVSIRYALIVPTSALDAAQRVPSRIRQMLGIGVYEVTPDGTVRPHAD